MDDFYELVQRARRLRDGHADLLAEAVVSEIGPEIDLELKDWRIRFRSVEYLRYRAEHERLHAIWWHMYEDAGFLSWAGRLVRVGEL